MSAPVISADVLIIGAGPAGSIAGALLAQRGRRVLCVERGFFPRFSIGESLLTRCNELLERANMLEAVQARNYMVKYGAEFRRGSEAVRFRFADGLPGTRPSTFQVPRADFDQTLATRARELGADIRFGQEVTGVDLGSRSVRLIVRDQESGGENVLEGKFLLDCSGYGRVLPRLLGIDAPAGLLPRAAYFCMVEGDQRPSGERAGDIWVCLHPEGAWIWIIPFSNGRTSVGVVATPETFARHAGSDKDKLWALLRGDPNTAERLGHAVPVTQTQKLTNWSAAVDKLHGERWAVAGNAGDFLDPVFSSGVCLALESASLAAELVHRELDGSPVDWSREYADEMKRAVAVFRVFVEGWYQGDIVRLFFAEHKATRARKAVTSILAGYVRDPQNPVVEDAQGTVRTLLRAIGTPASAS
jgi:flavin-dependent dehydrogenase